jgi:hypothetical protein
MSPFRQNRVWLVATLVLAMFAGAITPLHAGLCGDLPFVVAAAAEAPQASDDCHRAEAAAPCCCDGASASADKTTDGALTAARECGCAIEAPAQTPPTGKAPTSGNGFDLAALLPAAPHVALAVSAGTVDPLNTSEPPRQLPAMTQHSRGPPAC